MEAALAAILPGLIELIKSATADTYDQEAELQAILKMQRDLADARVKNAMVPPRT